MQASDTVSRWLGVTCGIAWTAFAALDASAASGTAPDLVYSTYLGGSGLDVGQAVAADAAGNTYVAGLTSSANFPLTSPTTPWFQESFLSKLGPDGNLLFSTFFGGSRGEMIYDIVVNGAGNIYVAGYSYSPEFPTVNSVPAEFRLHHQGLFISKLDPSGSIVYTAKMSGPSAASRVEDMAVDAQGNVYLLGFSSNPDFPTYHAFQPISGGGLDLIVVKLDRNGSLVYSTYLGGLNLEWPGGIKADAAGNAYLTGYTHSLDFPLAHPVAMARPTVWRSQAFVTKLSPDGSSLIYSTFLGGKGGSENATDLALDSAGNAYIVGSTGSPDFPVLNALQPTLRGTSDAFLVKLSPEPAMTVATFFGGSEDEWWQAVALGTDGRIHVTGTTRSPDYPLASPVDDVCTPVDAGRCQDDAVVTSLAPGLHEIVFSSFLGGSIPADTGQAADEAGVDIAADPAGNLYVTGTTHTSDFPVVNAVQSTHGGGEAGYPVDAFVTKIGAADDNQPPVCTSATATPSLIRPPNGKMIPVSISGVIDPDGDSVSITITRITQDEPLSGKGPDASGLGTSTSAVRADRAGKGDGRVYHLTFTATDPQGASCTGTVAVCVPHDRRPGSACGDGGGLIDSTGGSSSR